MAWKALGDGLPSGLGPRDAHPPLSPRSWGKSMQVAKSRAPLLSSLLAQTPALTSWLLWPQQCPEWPHPRPIPQNVHSISTPPSRPGFTALPHCWVSNTPHCRQASLVASLEGSAGQRPCGSTADPGQHCPVNGGQFHSIQLKPLCVGGRGTSLQAGLSKAPSCLRVANRAHAQATWPPRPPHAGAALQALVWAAVRAAPPSSLGGTCRRACRLYSET